MLMCKLCIARRLVVDSFPWCNANFVPFPGGTLVARRMQNGRITTTWDTYSEKSFLYIRTVTFSENNVLFLKYWAGDFLYPVLGDFTFWVGLEHIPSNDIHERYWGKHFEKNCLF